MRPSRVEADLVVDDEVVALAGDDHVVVAVGAALGGAAGLLGDDGADAGEQVALGLLAAEGAAHAADLDRDRVRGHVQHLGDHVLDLGRVLGRGVDRDLVVLARHRPARSAPRDRSAPGRRCASGPARRRGAAAIAALASPRRRVSGSVTRTPVGRAASASRIAGSSSYSTTASLAARRACSRVVAATAKIGWPTNWTRSVASSGSSWRWVGLTSFSPGMSAAVRTQTTPSARAHRRQVELDDPRMRLGREPELDVEQAGGLGQVVDIERLAGDVAPGAVVRARIVGSPLDAVRHGRGSGRRRGGSRPWRWSRHAAGAEGCGRRRAGSRPRRACR